MPPQFANDDVGAQIQGSYKVDPGLEDAPKVNGTPQVLSDTTEQALGKAVTYGPVGMGVGLIDTLGQSVGLFSDDSVQKTMSNVFPGGLGDYYARNRTPLRMGGEIVGMFIPGLIASKVLRSSRLAIEAGNLGQWAKNSTAVRTLLGNSEDLAQREAAIKAAATSASQSFGTFAGRTFSAPIVDGAKRAYYAARVAETARQTIAFEAGYRTLFNDSETFNPAEHTFSDEATWLGAGFAGGAALDLAVGRLAVRKLIQGVGRAATPASSYAATISEAVFRPGDRGVGVTQFAALSSDLEAISKKSVDPALVSNLAQDQTSIDSVLKSQISSLFADNHPMLPKTTPDDDRLKLVRTALKKNNTALLYSTKLGNIPEQGATAFYTELKDAASEAERVYHRDAGMVLAAHDDGKLTAQDAQQKLFDLEAARQRIVNAANEKHYVIENNGDWSVYLNRADQFLDNKGFSAIPRTTFKDDIEVQNSLGGVEFKNVTRSKLTPIDGIDLHDDFVLDGPKEMSPLQWSASYAAASKFISTYRAIDGQIFKVTPKVNRFTLEGMAELVTAKPEVLQSIQFGGGFRNMDDVMFHVVDQKYKAWAEALNNIERIPKNSVAKALYERSKISPEQVLANLNLPTQPGGPSPLIQVFTQAKMQNAKSLREIFENPSQNIADKTSLMDLLQASMRESAGVTDPSVKFSVSGNLFRQKDVRPVFVAAKDVPSLQRNDATIQAMVQTKRDLALQRLSQIDATAAPVISSVIRDIIGDAAVAPAKNVMSIFEGVLSGRGIVVPQDRINEQVEALKAASLLSQKSDKLINQMVAALAKNRLEPATLKLFDGKNRPDLIDFNRIEQSYRHGWDIKGIDIVNGRATFKLDPDSARNIQLAQKHFGDSVIADGKLTLTHMPDMSITAIRAKTAAPLNVSALSAQAAKAISDLSIQSGVEVNALRVALGSHSIKLRDFHLPTPDLSRQDAWFIRNSAGNVVDTYTRGTAGQNKSRALDAAKKLSDLHGEQHTAIPLDDVRREHSIFDDNFFDVIDYSDQLAKSGSGITGGFARAEIDTGPETLKSMIMSLNEQFLSAGVRARAAIFEPQLNYARQAGELTGKSVLKESNPFERYQSIIFSRSPQSPKGFLAAGYGAVESSVDNALSMLNAVYSEAIASTPQGQAGARSLKQIVKNQTSEQEFRQYNERAGQWSPFKTVDDWLASTHPEIPRWTARSLLAKASLVSSTMSLRLLDVGTALLNLSGVVATAPAIVSSMRKLAGESREEWLSRTAAYGSKISDKDIMTFSPMRAMMGTYHAFWKGDLSGPMAEAARLGYTKPEYAAMADVLSKPIRGEKAMDKWLGWASYAADASEEWSRAMAWGMGYKIGKDLHKFDDARNLYTFANNFQNEMIGNYNPRNKPGMFQGAVGLPLGAFQTYMFNYYRRMYGYLERKDWSTMVAAYGAQASLFGASSVPGWSAFNNTMFSNYDGSDNLATRLDRNLPPGVAELVLHGSMSSIPAIFGQGGIAFYPRGSVDLTQPIPNILDASRAPPIQFLSNTAQGIAATVSNIFGAGPTSIQNEEEILANFSTNRALKSIMEFAANAKTDRRGDVVENSTRDAIHVASAFLGAVPSRTKRLQDAYNAQQVVEMHQDALRTELTDKTRSLIRGGNFDTGDFQNLAKDYIQAGGDPQYFGQWLRNTTETAVTPKAVKKLQELSTNGRWIEFLNMLSALQQNAPKE